jgi:hypothetical protein
VDLDDPVSATLAVADALRVAGIGAAVYGGLALAAYGEARETRDADFAVVDIAPRAAQRALRIAGLDVSPSFERVRFGGNLITRFALLGSEAIAGFNVVDFVEPRSTRYAAELMRRVLHGELRGRPVTIVSPEDFVILKVLSTRERDLDDAASVIRTLDARFDLTMARDELASLAAEIADHDVAGRAARVLAGGGSPHGAG